jgi:hypothetical protein
MTGIQPALDHNAEFHDGQFDCELTLAVVMLVYRISELKTLSVLRKTRSASIDIPETSSSLISESSPEIDPAIRLRAVTSSTGPFFRSSTVSAPSAGHSAVRREQHRL